MSVEDAKSDHSLIIPIMYIVVNASLKMSSGKICGQLSHIVQDLTDHMIRSGYINDTSDDYINFKLWTQHGSPKILLKASQTEIIELIKLPKSKYIRDAGRTQIAPNSLTVVGFYPTIILNDMLSVCKPLFTKNLHTDILSICSFNPPSVVGINCWFLAA